ncbi:curli-like amyloid fiber formation chaperone CsgH [Noviherbaspirillum saxi]|uniref:curli-like amyloid fiber formation chaperone CsgH n=1 Tax=Noviherbaspirillum saxi TaxID=2320863 RepID=UPI00131476DF|nr:curli-like amyloid fiber formation chaperone CsgH [Noviherbaspirillum saxi]
MIGDADLQVWLDTTSQSGQLLVIPYVKSVNDMQLGFRMELSQQAQSGTSRISQRGQVAVKAADPTPLAQVTINANTGHCKVELVLQRDGRAADTYQFNCTTPRP